MIRRECDDVFYHALICRRRPVAAARIHDTLRKCSVKRPTFVQTASVLSAASNYRTQNDTRNATPQAVATHRPIQPIMLGSYFGLGARPKGPTAGATSPPSSYRVWGKDAGRRAGTLLAFLVGSPGFSCILETPDDFSWKLLGAKFGGGACPLDHSPTICSHPLNPPMHRRR